MDAKILKETAASIRCLSMDAIEKAKSGHPGLPLGAAELGAMLYGEFMKYDPKNPQWMNRDRFVLSAGHGSMFLYSILHIAGFDISLDDIKSFRQIGSKCAGHPEYKMAPGIETTTGPLGQGIATSVGMAIAETMLSSRFNTQKHNIFDHYTWVLAGDGCLQEGVASEAASIAGTLGLGKLILFYDDNHITIDGNTSLTFTEDVGARFAAYHWQVLHADMYDADSIRKAVIEAKKDSQRPSIIITKSTIGKGAPTVEGTSKAHGAPLGAEGIIKAKAESGIPEGKDFWVSEEAKAWFDSYAKKLADERIKWEAEYSQWKKDEPEKAKELDAMISGKAIEEIKWPELKDPIATRNASGKALQEVYKAYPGLVGGSADLTGPNVTKIPSEPYSKENRSGRMIHYGIREHAMAAISNGLALHGPFKPFCATFLVFADYLRPSLRLSALMGLPVVYVFSHDSIFVGEDGPTHQPIEHLASLRAIPNVLVLRPADAEETCQAWKWAMERTEGPTVIAISRQNLNPLTKEDPDWTNTFRTGAYVVKNCSAEPDVVFMASGSEVNLALEAAKLVQGKNVRVVSVPSLETFVSQDKAIKDTIVPPKAKVIGCEAARSMIWDGITDKFLGIERFGESGPGAKVAVELGLTAENLAKLAE